MSSGLERVLARASGKDVVKKKVPVKVTNGSVEALKKAIDKHLVDSNKREGIKKSVGFGPSKTSLCARYWYISFKGAMRDEKVNPRTQRIFDNGHAVHDRWYKYFNGMGIMVDEEIPIVVNDPVPIIGFADAVVDWDGNKLVEMKSIGMEGFQYRKHFNKPKDDHYNQAQLYLYALKLEKGYVIYEDKSSQDFLIFEIEKDDEHIEKLLRRYKKWYKFVKEDVVPPRPYKRDSKQCNWCEFETECWDRMKSDEENN